MIYALFIVGIALSIYGWRIIIGEKDEKIVENYSKLDIIEDKIDLLLKSKIEFKEVGEIGKHLKTKTPLNRKIETNQEKTDIGIELEEDLEAAAISNTDETQNIKDPYQKEDEDKPDYIELAKEIKTMAEENMTIEEMASILNIGKGEVLLLKRLLIK